MTKTEKLLQSDGQLYQPMVILYGVIKVGPFRKRSSATFYSPHVFLDPDMVTKYFPTFIKELIADGSIAANAITRENKINYSIIETTVAPCILSAIELDEAEDE